MSITDELRGFANSGMSAMECSAYSDKLIDIADRIDKTHEDELTKLKAENAKLREQMDWLVTLLRADCDIEASWDGLRKFWSIGLTEDGCLMRDRACKAEAENAKLLKEFDKMDVWHSKELTAAMAENTKLREMARNLHMAYVETLNECESLNEGLIWEYSGSIEDDVAKSRAKFKADRHRFDDALCELGIEVSK